MTLTARRQCTSVHIPHVRRGTLDHFVSMFTEKPDSFTEFRRLKEIVVDRRFEYRLVPMRADGKVVMATNDNRLARAAESSTDRDESLGNEGLGLLGHDHPLVETYIGKFWALLPNELGIRCGQPTAAPECFRSGTLPLRASAATSALT